MEGKGCQTISVKKEHVWWNLCMYMYMLYMYLWIYKLLHGKNEIDEMQIIGAIQCSWQCNTYNHYLFIWAI